MHTLAVLLLLFPTVMLLAQTRGGDPRRSSRGKEFRLAFPPNYHEVAAGSTTRPANNDSLYIFITCDKPTSGTISYRNINGQRFSRTYQISDPAQFYIFSLGFQDFELESFNYGSRANPRAQYERIAPQSFRITANDDVTVYALNQARFTSDAWLVLPVVSLSKEYCVMSYNSDARGLPTDLSITNISTPSQFCVIAHENNTRISISPAAPMILNPTGGTVSVTLNEGDVYLVQADPRTQGGLADLTGSRVVADKPVVVIGGHQRTTLPVRLRDQLSSRDCLIEQIPGIETWGKESFLTPFALPNSAITAGTDLYRVLAAFDSTKVFVNRQQVATLQANEFYEGRLIEPAVVTASDQILVAQYKKTANGSNSINTTMNIGDPFMLVIPTTEQYDTNYRFINVRAPDPNLSSGQVFNEHFITVVIPTQFRATVKVDDRAVSAAAFQPITGSGYSFANLQLDPGVHTARADTAFGLYVYGYGQANSYGYIGGGKLRIIAPDRDRPVIEGRAQCFEFRGIVYDTLATDSRISTVELRPATAANVTLSVEPFTPYADSVRFAARLVNTFQDGAFTVRAQDSIGFVTQRLYPIYGFTVGLEGQNSTAGAQTRTYTVASNRSRAFPLTLVNYGATTQTITALNFSNGTASSPRGFFMEERLPLVLAPSSRATVNVRFTATANGTFADTLIIVSTCATRTAAILKVDVGEDTMPPSVANARDECARTVSLQFDDAQPFAAGIQSFEVGTQINCTVRVDSIVNSLRVQGVVTIANPNLDAVYSLRVRDSSGNTRLVSDTVQGLTIRILAQRASATAPDTAGKFGVQAITSMPCQTLVFRNVGLKPFAIPLLAPLGNIYFSLPPRQFPITLAPGEERSLEVCFSPLQAREYRDTLRLERFCTNETLMLTGAGNPISRIETTRCNAEVQLTTSAAPLDFFTQQNFPNPASDLTTILVGLPTQARTTVKLYSALGTYVATLVDGVLPAGVVGLQVDVSRLETGVYLYEVQTPTRRTMQRLTVTR